MNKCNKKGDKYSDGIYGKDTVISDCECNECQVNKAKNLTTNNELFQLLYTTNGFSKNLHTDDSYFKNNKLYTKEDVLKELNAEYSYDKDDGLLSEVEKFFDEYHTARFVNIDNSVEYSEVIRLMHNYGSKMYILSEEQTKERYGIK